MYIQNSIFKIKILIKVKIKKYKIGMFAIKMNLTS